MANNISEGMNNSDNGRDYYGFIYGLFMYFY